MIAVILIGLMYVLSIGLGVGSVALVGYMPLKSFKDFGILLLYIIGLYIGLKLVVLIICWILNKFFDCDFDSDGRKQFSIIYFVVSFIGIIICTYIETKSIFSTILITILMALFNLMPLAFEFGGEGIDFESISTSKSNSYSNKYDIKSGYVTDEFGNIKAKSTTYIDGDIKKTYVTDNLGNTIAESTTIGNHTTTKIK